MRLIDDGARDYGYESPIHLIISEIANKIAKETDEATWAAIQRVGIDVDKDELIKALRYDREQFKKGFDYAAKHSVSLDKLCEWLATNPAGGCPPNRPPMCMDVGCPECWKIHIKKWMEGLDEAD